MSANSHSPLPSTSPSFSPENRRGSHDRPHHRIDPHAASDDRWAAFKETGRAIAREFLPDGPILDDVELRREIQTTNPKVRVSSLGGDGLRSSIELPLPASTGRRFDYGRTERHRIGPGALCGSSARDVLVALLPVFTGLFADVPLGELEMGPIRWEMNGYETLERIGSARHLVLRRAPDGSVASLSEAG